MMRISPEDLVIKIGSVFKLTIIAAKRAIELNDGAESLLKKDNTVRTISMALNEIEAGKVSFKEVKPKKDVNSK